MTNGFILQLGLSWQSYAIFFLIILWTGLLIAGLTLLYDHILKERRKRKETANNNRPALQIHQKKKQGHRKQLTLESIGNKLASIEPKKYKSIVTILAEVISPFQEHLRIRPYTQTEANELFIIYSQICYWAMNYIPVEESIDLKSFLEDNRTALRVISNRIGHLGKNWLVGMAQCLAEIYQFLSRKKFYEGFPHIDLQIIKYLLSKHADLIINEFDDRTYYHLPDEDYNEFGIELREEYFNKTFYSMTTSQKEDSDTFLL